MGGISKPNQERDMMIVVTSWNKENHLERGTHIVRRAVIHRGCGGGTTDGSGFSSADAADGFNGGSKPCAYCNINRGFFFSMLLLSC